jgi:hypothetical protein
MSAKPKPNKKGTNKMHISDIELPKLSELIKNPSGLDSLANYMGEIPEDCWRVVLTRSRDSTVLTDCNWTVALEELGGEGEDVKIDRFGHWGCGWWEALSVRDGSEKMPIAQGMHASLSDYPILDEEKYCEQEQEEADRVWSDCYNTRERLSYIRRNRSDFRFDSLADVIACAKGRSFLGCASDLLA